MQFYSNIFEKHDKDKTDATLLIEQLLYIHLDIIENEQLHIPSLLFEISDHYYIVSFHFYFKRSKISEFCDAQCCYQFI